MGKIIEGLWDCPFCGNKRIRAGQKPVPIVGIRRTKIQNSICRMKLNMFLRRMLLILGIFAAIIFGMMSCLAPKIKNVTIDDLDWERTIDIEEVVTHNKSDWSLPDDARLQYTKSEIQSYKDVLDHYETVTETKTRSVIDHYEEKSSYVDLGNG